MSFINLIETKQLVIYGTGNTGIEFYNKYRNVLKLDSSTSSDKEVVPLLGTNAVKQEELDKSKSLLIICSVHYDEIRKTLMIQGWKQNVNFMRWDIFETLYEAEQNKKQIIVAVGQCEIREMREAFIRVPTFMKKYAIIYFDERKVCVCGDRFDILEYYDCAYVLGKTQIFLRPSVLTPKSVQSFEYLEKNISSQCRVIKVSLFIFDSYWPQDIAKDRETNELYVVRPNTKIPAFVESERVIGKMLEAGNSNREIREKITNEDFFDKSLVCENHKKALKRIRLSDKLSDIKVYDYTENYFDKVKLFCDRGHFNENMLKVYVRDIFSYLQEEESIKEFEKIDISDIFSSVNELPIYPSTAKILDLQWVDRHTLYRMNINNVVKMVTFDEYMEAAIEYYSIAYKLVKICYS